MAMLNGGLGKAPRLSPATNALDHALAEALSLASVSPHEAEHLPGQTTTKKPKIKVKTEQEDVFPTWDRVPVCNDRDGRQIEGGRHPDVRFRDCVRPDLQLLGPNASVCESHHVVLNVNESELPGDKKPKEIEWPGDTLDAATLETGVEETIFREIPEKDSDRGPEFDFPDFSADEPDAYRVTFQNKAQPTEQITCSDLYPKVPQPQKIEDKTIPLRLGENLTAEQRKAFLRLAAEFVGVFLRPPGKWKAAKVPPYHIETGNAPPVFQPYRQVPMHQRHLVEEEVESMLKKGVISKTKSPYVNPIVLVKKKVIDDGKKGASPKTPLRFCIDLRMLNKQQMPYVQRGGIPRIKDVLDSLRGSRFYSAIDLAAAFWAIELTESSKHKTAFLCYYKGVPQQFQFNKLVFGSLGASWAMQNAMNYCLRGLQPHITSVYLDDCVIPGFTFEQHIANLRKVFSRLQAHGFFIQPAKCVFGQNFLSVLGFTVSHKGIEVQKSKTEAICKMPPPKNKKEVQTFLGLVNFYSSFLLNKSTLLSCLHELTKDKPFVWTKECQQAFEEVKRRLTSPPILAFPDPDAEMIVAVDASNVGVGGILQQKDESGRLRIIACTSRKLTEQQSKAWTVAEKELFSLVHSVQAFDYYLRGQRFRVLTDHKLLANLKFLLKWDRPGRLLRWRLLLQGLDMVVESVKGSDNGPADALSRFPSNDISQVTSVGSINFVSPISMPDAEAMRLAQLADPLYARLINRLKGNPQHDEDINELLAYGGKYELNKINSLLTHSNRFGQGLTVIPPKLRWKVFAFFHNQAGHLAAKKTHSFMRTKVYWRGMSTDIQEFCFQCATCQAGKRKPNKRYGRLQLFSAKRPNQSVGVDVFGPLPETPRGNKVILVMYDRFTRYCSYVPMPNQQSETIARTFFSHWISRFGIPETILTDNYASFLNVGKYLWEKFFKIRHKKISFYMASTNGATERANQVLAATLRSWVDQDSQNDWDLYCDAISFATRATVVEATGFTPHYLTHFTPISTPTDLLYGKMDAEFADEKTYAEKTAKMVRHAFKAANHAQKTADSRKKEHFDKNKIDFFFKKGDKVNIFTPRGKEGLSYKLTQKNRGPYIVVKRLSDVHYRVKPGIRNEPFQTVHIRRMMRYYPEPVDTDSSDSDSDTEQHSIKNRNRNAVRHSLDRKHSLSENSSPPESQAARNTEQKCSSPQNRPTIIDSKPGQNGDFSRFLLRIGNEQFWVTKEELSSDLLLQYEATRRSRRASRRAR